MEQTFMTIHNLTAEANILFVSDSVTDILGYQPDEVQGKSCFDYFHPDEVPFARSVHSRGVLLDKAAVLHYCRILSQDGRWVSCECCFTVVHDVLVASTSIYRRGEKSQRRAIEAPQIRRIFSCSPRDPRYHMLEHLSPRFKMPPMEREPRAALILNRFTRNLTVMFATNAVSSILGLTPAQIKHKSFYRCIQENCLADALKCLEGAKANDSIAYLRFWSRDPRDEIELDEDERETEEQEQEEASSGEEMTNDSDALDGSGPTIGNPMEIDTGTLTASDVKVEGCFVNGGSGRTASWTSVGSLAASGALDSGSSSPRCQTFGSHGMNASQSCSATRPRASSCRRFACRSTGRQRLPSIELEAVVSCTSDGLVVVLRKARPPIPPPHPPLLPFDYENGLFAAPWAQQPIRPYFPPELLYTFRPPLLPQYMPLRENVKAAGGPPLDQLMRSIRDVAVFAWALVGINGNLGAYAHGLPTGEAFPQDALGGNMPFYVLDGQVPMTWSRKDNQGSSNACYSPPSYPADVSHGYTQGLPGLGNYAYPRQSVWSGSPHMQYGVQQPPANSTSQHPAPDPAHSRHPPHESLFPNITRESSTAGPTVPPGGHADFPSPTQQAPSPGEPSSPRSFRDMWR